jgi:hypothetical protein
MVRKIYRVLLGDITSKIHASLTNAAGVMRSHLDKPAVRSMFSEFLRIFDGLKIETISVHGAHDFCVWESQTKFIVGHEMAEIPFRKGEEATLYCASLIWWNMDRKILKEVDYAVWKR